MAALENVVKIHDTMTDSFRPGEIVVLKSGSPPMTVRSVTGGNKRSPMFVKVDWFAEADNMSTDFLADQLLHIEDIPEEEFSDEEEAEDKEATKTTLPHKYSIFFLNLYF